MRWMAFVAVLALAGCKQQHSPQDQAVRDAHAVAAVEQVNRSAIKPLEPQIIMFPDIENNHLDGPGCEFAEGNSIGAVLLSRKDRAYMKLADKVEEFTADAGSAELLGGARAKYRGNDLVLQFSIDSAHKSAAGHPTYPGHLTAQDLDGNVVLDQTGTVQCDR